MFDIGMTELLVIGIVALIVVGPKDLPGMFRTLGRFTGKMRGMAREFQQAMNDAADEAAVKDIGKDLKGDLKGMANPKRYGLDKLNEAADTFEKWDPAKSGKGSRPAGATRDREAAARPAAEAPQAGPAAKETGTAADTPLSRGGEDPS